MFFPQRKIDRIMKWSRKRRMKADGIGLKEDGTVDEDNLPTDDELRELNLEDEMEKGDMGAMILSGCLTVFPVAIIVLLLLGLVCILFAGGF